MNYDFHVGDYVETADGGVGYIDHTNDYVSWHCTKCDNWFAAGFSYSVINKETGMPMTHFARIGQYDFTKKDNQIEKLTYAESYLNGYQVLTGKKLIDTINELVDAVNELRKK